MNNEPRPDVEWEDLGPDTLFHPRTEAADRTVFVVRRKRGSDVYLRAADLADAIEWADQQHPKHAAVDAVEGEIPEGARVESVPIGYADEDARRAVERGAPDPEPEAKAG